MRESGSDGGGADLKRPTAIVAIGASAGGLEAFRALVAALPANGGIAYVLLSHLSPSHPSLMPQILARETALPVTSARDDLRVEPDHVYVLPPAAFLEIENGVLRLESYGERREVRTPIDRFFTSLAKDAERRAVAIVLSGSGSDGALGVAAIRDAGGLTIAQEPETAAYEGMPRSAIANGAIDLVLEVAEIPARLAVHVRQLDSLEQAAASPDFQEEIGNTLADVHEIVRRRTGHDMSRYKEGTIVRRIVRRMQVHHLPSAAAYVDLLRRDPEEVDRLFGELLIGVTSFFRDPAAFDFLAREMIPKLFEGKSAEDPFRLWVPACSGGEETYSFAILLAEEVARRRREVRVQIFASDIHPGAIEMARRAVYPEGIVDQVSPERLERFFVRDGDGYRVRKEIREMCVFSSHSLIRHPPFSRLDLISCRNLMIYLKPDLQEKIAAIFHYALRPGGVLFLGSSENVADRGELFRPVHRKFRVFERTGIKAPSLPDLPLARLANPSALRPEGRPREESGGQRIARALEQALLAEYAPACAVVDANGRAVFFSGSIGRYLEPAAGVANHDLVEMARGSLRLELRAALHQATTSKAPVVQEPLVVDTALGRATVKLAVRPLVEPAAGAELWMITFEELEPAPAVAEAPAVEPARHEAALVAELESEIRETKQHLHRVIVELESTNAELKSANEELLSMNEELQSTNEELETSKEELQSVNEELETVNAELLRKVDELDVARSDVQNLFDSTRIATLFLDERLCIKRFTPATEELFRLIPSDVGRPLTDLVTRFESPDLGSILEQVLGGGEPVEREVRVAESGAVYLARVLPYRTEGRSRGVILTFVEVTRLRRAQRDEARLAAVVEQSQDAIFAATLDGVITDWNQGAADVYGWTAAAIGGEPLRMLFPEEHRAELDDALERLRRGEAVEPLELANLRADGSRIDVVLGLSPIRDPGGRIVAISAIARDVTVRRREQRRLEEEARRKDGFLAVLGHEIRNPLSAIRNGIHVLRRSGAGDDAAETARAVVDRQSAQLARLVDDLLDLSRISTGRIVYHTERFDLAARVRETVEDQRIAIESGGVALELELPPAPLEVDADPSRIAQAVGNLLENARKFTRQGGRIDVRLAPSADGAGVDVLVADTGIGMAPETIEHLFEPFPHVSPRNPRGEPGLGLGLALVKALIEDQGGSVAARSAGADRGSEFVIRLPLAKPRAASARGAEGDGGAAEPAPSRRILLVEDEPDAAESMKLLLELAGHRVTLASDGAGAIAAATEDPPEVLLCDIGLPGELDGYEVAAALRGEPRLRSVFFVALTGFGRAPDRKRALGAGFDVHLTKPVDPTALERLLRDDRASRRP